MLKIVVFDSGYGGEFFADRLEEELATFKAISERSLSLSNLKQFGKIKQFAIDNEIMNDEIQNVFDEVEKENE